MAERKAGPNSIITKIANGEKFEPEDIYIAIMGVTGAGKSTFISKCASGAKIGHGLESCTFDIEVFTFTYNDRRIHLIDTPGFDDTYRTDSDVLKDLAYWLVQSYKAHTQLSGVVYLHPINRNRLGGAALKNLRMFRKLCGEANLSSVILATTMWDNVDLKDGEIREHELKTTPSFWGNMVDQGSRVFRHEDSRSSAMNIINYILDQQRTLVLDIQRQMGDQNQTLDQTPAGQEVEKELLKQRENFERKLKEAQEEMKEAIEEGNKAAIQEAQEQEERFTKKLQDAMKGSNELKINMEKLMEQKDAEYARAMDNLERQRKQAMEEAKMTSARMDELRREMQAKSDVADEEIRRQQQELQNMSMRLEMQNNENQYAMNQWLLDQQLRAAMQSAVPNYPAHRSAASAFDRNFKSGAGDAIGQAAGVAVGTAIAGTLTSFSQGGNCTLM